MAKDSFSEWLNTKKGLQTNSSRDVVSRLKRCRTLLPQNIVIEDIPADEVILYLERNDNFKHMSVTVRSQIKRAVKLYIEYTHTELSH
ncbi:hypothetical protein [Vibrio parahaemolyticus]|uniref:hypothetical protein n=1 Tax=Vibrio parahaemolyticus TaxID=670 RepID=UPI0038924528